MGFYFRKSKSLGGGLRLNFSKNGIGISGGVKGARLSLGPSGLNFYGNVETKDILEPPTDILISDGFTTNMVVKCMEGTAKSMGKMLKNNLKRGFFGKIGALLSMKNLNN